MFLEEGHKVNGEPLYSDFSYFVRVFSISEESADGRFILTDTGFKSDSGIERLLLMLGRKK